MGEGVTFRYVPECSNHAGKIAFVSNAKRLMTAPQPYEATVLRGMVSKDRFRGF